MRISSQADKLGTIEAALYVVPVRAADLPGKRKRGAAGSGLAQVEQLFGVEFGERLRNEEFRADPLAVSVFKVTSGRAKAVVFVGWPDEKQREHEDPIEQIDLFRRFGWLVGAQARQHRAERAIVVGEALAFGKEETVAFGEGAELSAYRYDKYKSKTAKKSGEQTTRVREITLVTRRKLAAGALREGQVLAEATSLARDLINMPPCDCTPAFLVKTGKEIARKGKLRAQVFDRAKLEQLRAGGILSVSRGSEQPPFLLKLVYTPGRRAKRVISIVGKGVTFDSGGLSIKPGGSMVDMKCDMSGAAAVLGVMQAVAKLRPGVEVRAYIPTTENMINGRATRPGDVIRALSGKTIEVLNTDAEGRLILADALHMAEKDGCDQIIDLATLTGACVVALGSDYAGLFSNDERLREALVSCGVTEGERLWPMPLAKEYRDQIKSKVADIKNVGGSSGGGAITAALFLAEFVSDTKWAHIDIAGPAFSNKAKYYQRDGGVGFGVRTVVRHLLNQ